MAAPIRGENSSPVLKDWESEKSVPGEWNNRVKTSGAEAQKKSADNATAVQWYSLKIDYICVTIYGPFVNHLIIVFLIQFSITLDILCTKLKGHYIIRLGLQGL